MLGKGLGVSTLIANVSNGELRAVTIEAVRERARRFVTWFA
jgi:hypothetical protein